MKKQKLVAVAISMAMSVAALLLVVSLVFLTPDLVKADPPENFAVWDFEGETTVPSIDLTGNAEAASGSGLGGESFPSGNGSTDSWSFNNWSTGALDNNDHFQFKVDLTNYAHITLIFGERRSSTGIRDFEVHYSTDGTDFTQIAATVTNVPDNTSWRSHSFDFGSGTSVDQAISGESEVYFRIYGYNAEGSSGTWRIDDVTFHAAEVFTSNNFSISKTAPDMVSPNEVFTYTIVVANSTGITTTGTAITDVVPTNADFASASDGGVLVGDTVSWMISGNFVDGDVVTRTFQVTATSSSGANIVNEDYGVRATNWVTMAAGSPITTVVSPLDLMVTKAGPEYAVIGENIVYTITLNNQGVATATNVTLTDTLPVSTTYVSDTSGVIPTNPSPRVYVWSLGDVFSGTITTFNLTVAVDSGVTSGTVLTNTAEASTDTPGDNPANNTAFWTTIVGPPDLSGSTKTVEPMGNVNAGDYLTYTVTLSNSGETNATVTITDTLPGALLLVSGLDGGGLTWSGMVTGGEEVQLTLVVQADPTITADTAISNVVTINDGIHALFDIHSPDTTILVPNLSIVKEVTPTADLPPGGVVTYTITLSNSGDGIATDVVMTDVLPVEVDFGGWIVQPIGAVEANDTITWTVDIPAGMDTFIVFTATVGSDPALYGQTVTNTALFASTNAGSGSADAVFTIEEIYSIYLPLVVRNCARYLEVYTDKMFYRPGEGVAIIVKNISNQTVEFPNLQKIRILNASGTEVYPCIYLPACSQLDPNESQVYLWNQEDCYGNPAPLGEYTVVTVSELPEVNEAIAKFWIGEGNSIYLPPTPPAGQRVPPPGL